MRTRGGGFFYWNGWVVALACPIFGLWAALSFGPAHWNYLVLGAVLGLIYWLTGRMVLYALSGK